MKTLYIECNMGATDTMLLSALYDACGQKASFMEMMNDAFSPFKVTITTTPISKCGVTGNKLTPLFSDPAPAALPTPPTQISAKNETEEHLNYLLAHAMLQHNQESAASAGKTDDNDHISATPKHISELNLPIPVKEDVIAIYDMLGNVANALGQPALIPLPLNNRRDAEFLINIIGCALLIYMMAPEQIVCSPIHIGSGFVKTGNTVVSVPAPTTAALLKDVPCYTSNITGALLDDSNAAVLKYFVTQFGVMPTMTIHSIGYGIGANDSPISNFTRVFWGDTELATTPAVPVSESFSNMDTIISIACNVDDMTGEALSLATEILLAAGALDVYTTSIQMKKNRPGVLLTCLCEEADLEKFIGLFFLHTSTQDVRYQSFTRAKLESTVVSKHSSYGNVRVKKSSGFGVEKEKPDFEDLKSIVLKNGITIADIEFDE